MSRSVRAKGGEGNKGVQLSPEQCCFEWSLPPLNRPPFCSRCSRASSMIAQIGAGTYNSLTLAGYVEDRVQGTLTPPPPHG